MAFGIDQGPSSQETGQYNLLNSSSQFATGMGQNNLSLSSQFFSNLLTDPTKALAPEISAGQTQTQQQAKTNAEMGTRSGGTTGAAQAGGAANRANVINLMGSTQTGAASNLASSGANLLGQGMQGEEAGFGEANTMQQQRAKMWSDLIGSIASTAGGAVAGIPGAPGGAADIGSNMLAGLS